jgi:hypothetical protein
MGSPDRGCGRDPCGPRCGVASYWPAAADPAAGGVAGRRVGQRVAWQLVAGRTGSGRIGRGHARVWPLVCLGPPLSLRISTAAQVLDEKLKKKGRRRVKAWPAAMFHYAWSTGQQGAHTRVRRVAGSEDARAAGGRRARHRWRGRGGGAARCWGLNPRGARRCEGGQCARGCARASGYSSRNAGLGPRRGVVAASRRSPSRRHGRQRARRPRLAGVFVTGCTVWRSRRPKTRRAFLGDRARASHGHGDTVTLCTAASSASTVCTARHEKGA